MHLDAKAIPPGGRESEGSCCICSECMPSPGCQINSSTSPELRINSSLLELGRGLLKQTHWMCLGLPFHNAAENPRAPITCSVRMIYTPPSSLDPIGVFYLAVYGAVNIYIIIFHAG